MMEYIKHTSWKTLCDVEFSDKNPTLPPDGALVFVHMEHIYQFFKAIERSDRRYIVISADSDFCLTEQARYPVWKDMQKWFNFIPITAEEKYNPIVIAPRCDASLCRIDDMFSVKVYSFTKNTFSDIPENIVHWYTTNCDLNFPGIEHIPFGIPDWSYDLIQAGRNRDRHLKDDRLEKIYANFQVNTLERVSLKNYFSNIAQAIVPQNEVSHSEFIEALFEMKYILSPPGNGFDCFRTLEAIYCGAYPVIVDAPWNEPYFSLPVVKTDNLFSFANNNPERIDLDGTTADFSYWRNKISERVKIFRDACC